MKSNFQKFNSQTSNLHTTPPNYQNFQRSMTMTKPQMLAQKQRTVDSFNAGSATLGRGKLFRKNSKNKDYWIDPLGNDPLFSGSQTFDDGLGRQNGFNQNGINQNGTNQNGINQNGFNQNGLDLAVNNANSVAGSYRAPSLRNPGSLSHDMDAPNFYATMTRRQRHQFTGQPALGVKQFTGLIPPNGFNTGSMGHNYSTLNKASLNQVSINQANFNSNFGLNNRYVAPQTPHVPQAFQAQQYGTLSRAQLNKLRQASRPNFPRTSTNQLATHAESGSVSGGQMQTAGSLRDLPPPPPLPLKSGMMQIQGGMQHGGAQRGVMPPPPQIGGFATLQHEHRHHHHHVHEHNSGKKVGDLEQNNNLQSNVNNFQHNVTNFNFNNNNNNNNADSLLDSIEQDLPPELSLKISPKNVDKE